MEYNKEIKTLIIHYTFNEKLKDLPEETKIIIFDEEYPNYSNFNQTVDKLPQNITHLTFGFRFNQKVDKLPQSITHLTFSWVFDQTVDNLPQNLTHLTFGYDFNQKVDNLPFLVKKIKIHNQKLITKIPFGCKIIQY